MVEEEVFEIVDENDQVIGTALRSECHGNPDLIHRTAHVIVFNSNNEILLQKRAASKDIQPGKWDTAVGGHLDIGENYEQAARREMNEELGISEEQNLEFLFKARIRNSIESENISVYKTVYDGSFSFPELEISEIRFWKIDELYNKNNQRDFTPNLLEELQELKKYL